MLSYRVLNSRARLNVVVLTTLWPQTFFFPVCMSSFSSLIPHCCRSAERIWNIYQGIVCWRHNFDMVMLLAFEITVCIGGQNNLFVETVLMFSGTGWHECSFLLTCRAIRMGSWTSNWFKMQLLNLQMWILKLNHSGGRFLFYLCLWANLL